MTESREGRGRAQVRDPAQAIAMAKCWLATWTRRAGPLAGLPPTDSFHPSKCGFCDMPRDLLIQMLEEFQSWASISSYDDTTALRLEVEAWETIPASEQAIKVKRAQGYYDKPGSAERADARSPW